jgi:hypothetical protein
MVSVQDAKMSCLKRDVLERTGRYGAAQRLSVLARLSGVSKTEVKVAADATGGRDRVGLRHPDGLDTEGQRAA